MGQEILKSLTPDQAVLRIVRDEMVEVLGGAEPRALAFSSQLPSVILMTGLQGSGKTTTTAKLGRWLKGRGRHPLLVSTDVQRPAAREQLRAIGASAEVAVFHPELAAPGELLRKALAEARAVGHDTLIVDSAGRLHIDDALMAELAEQRAVAEPAEVLYVADALTGQDAVKSAARVPRQDRDHRHRAHQARRRRARRRALSAASVTGQPVKFAGTGEKVDAFEPFDPARMVSRLLGMGDVLGLIARAEETVDREQAEAFARKLRRAEFTLEDYRDQIKQLRKMGPLDQVLSMIPGVSGAMKGVDLERGEQELRRTIAIIDSMTPRERAEPSVINGSRRKRIARGSGHGRRGRQPAAEAVRTGAQADEGARRGAAAMKRLASRMPQFR
jgi:signal recognition particle subunit SRP54